MSHDPHHTHASYSPDQVLYDGCGECTWRSEHVSAAIDHMDMTTFARAWVRAGQYMRHGLDDLAGAELPVLTALGAVQRRLENLGLPIGVLPGSPLAPFAFPARTGSGR